MKTTEEILDGLIQCGLSTQNIVDKILNDIDWIRFKTYPQRFHLMREDFERILNTRLQWIDAMIHAHNEYKKQKEIK